VPQIVSEKARYGLQLVLGDDGVYRVTVGGVLHFESRVLSAAQIEFDEAADTLSARTREARSRELADFTARGVLAKANQAKAASRNAGRSRGKGG
jgi:hypothetical protein